MSQDHITRWTNGGKSPKAADIAAYGHIAERVGEWLARHGNDINRLHEAIGRTKPGDAHVTLAYGWAACRNAPSARWRGPLAQVLGVPEAELAPRLPGPKRSHRRVPDNPTPAATTTLPIQFTVGTDGVGELSLKMRGDPAELIAVMQLLLADPVIKRAEARAREENADQ
jgi:hypothetical protein